VWIRPKRNAANTRGQCKWEGPGGRCHIELKGKYQGTSHCAKHKQLVASLASGRAINCQGPGKGGKAKCGKELRPENSGSYCQQHVYLNASNRRLSQLNNPNTGTLTTQPTYPPVTSQPSSFAPTGIPASGDSTYGPLSSDDTGVSRPAYLGVASEFAYPPGPGTSPGSGFGPSFTGFIGGGGQDLRHPPKRAASVSYDVEEAPDPRHKGKGKGPDRGNPRGSGPPASITLDPRRKTSAPSTDSGSLGSRPGNSQTGNFRGTQIVQSPYQLPMDSSYSTGNSPSLQGGSYMPSSKASLSASGVARGGRPERSGSRYKGSGQNSPQSAAGASPGALVPIANPQGYNGPPPGGVPPPSISLGPPLRQVVPTTGSVGGRLAQSDWYVQPSPASLQASLVDIRLGGSQKPCQNPNCWWRNSYPALSAHPYLHCKPCGDLEESQNTAAFAPIQVPASSPSPPGLCQGVGLGLPCKYAGQQGQGAFHLGYGMCEGCSNDFWCKERGCTNPAARNCVGYRQDHYILHGLKY